MYLVAFGHDYGREVRAPVVLKQCKTLEEAAAARETGGDLVFDALTREIVTNPMWLWEWEKKKKNCYAQRKIAMGAVLVLSREQLQQLLRSPR